MIPSWNPICTTANSRERVAEQHNQAHHEREPIVILLRGHSKSPNNISPIQVGVRAHSRLKWQLIYSWKAKLTKIQLEPTCYEHILIPITCANWLDEFQHSLAGLPMGRTHITDPRRRKKEKDSTKPIGVEPLLFLSIFQPWTYDIFCKSKSIFLQSNSRLSQLVTWLLHRLHDKRKVSMAWFESKFSARSKMSR